MSNSSNNAYHQYTRTYYMSLPLALLRTHSPTHTYRVVTCWVCEVRIIGSINNSLAKLKQDAPLERQIDSILWNECSRFKRNGSQAVSDDIPTVCHWVLSIYTHNFLLLKLCNRIQMLRDIYANPYVTSLVLIKIIETHKTDIANSMRDETMRGQNLYKYSSGWACATIKASVVKAHKCCKQRCQ